MRLLRNSTFVRRQAYIEFDLVAILEESRFQDFVVLYRLLHRTRLPRGMANAGDCLLEKYYAHSVEQGDRVREHLRDGVSGSSPRRVNYAALDVEELGSVYESLLEFHPAVDHNAAGRPEFKLIFGSERKTTGSYYTPPELVNVLIQSTLDPVIRDRLATHPREPEKVLLSIRICDPACGSGHFLLAAARRLGKELARVRTGENEPAPERMRDATRDVISHCIYG